MVLGVQDKKTETFLPGDRNVSAGIVTAKLRLNEANLQVLKVFFNNQIRIRGEYRWYANRGTHRCGGIHSQWQGVYQNLFWLERKY
jgi:hypothetical protein